MVPQKMLTKVLTVGAVIGALVVAFVAGTGSVATATQGQPIVAGVEQTETLSTVICRGSVLCGSYPAALAAVYGATGSSGERASAIRGVADGTTQFGMYGSAGTTRGAGVYGNAQGTAAAGVEGEGANSFAFGVWGHGNATGVLGEGRENGVQANGGTFGVFARGTDYGVYASAPNHGLYGAATTNAGAGLEGQAASASGFGLRVTGKAQFSRSGTATITGTTTTMMSSIVISNVAVNGKSLVLATPQKNVAGVWVQAAVPNTSAKTITIFLNKAVTASYPVAWMVIERP